jgi:hypothetical protein
MKNTALLWCVAFSAYAFSSFAAHSQTLEAKLISISPALSVNGTFNGGSTTANYTSGVNNFVNLSDSLIEFDAFCVEPTAFISVNQTLTYQVSDLSHLTNADKVARLVGGFLGSSKTAADAAAVQWAIWEVTSDAGNPHNLSNGKVQVSSANLSTQTLGNKYLANINNFTKANITYLTNSKYQNMVAFTPIPEPTTLGLAALSCFTLLRRRR